MEYRYKKQSYQMDAHIGGYFKEIMVYEDQLIESLADIFS